ncbi:universal stress protein [Kitasatospora sp. NPDC028055]|uniref:universal stress protein n=1 Tax=Kitasatospora sp. NPDC028055 TaxID=3155653 RepID=UPI0033C298DC
MAAFVLAAVDGSPESLAAAGWAADEAVRRGLRLRLVHAWPWPQHAAPGLPGVSEVRGRVVGVLADAAQRLRADHPGLEVDVALMDEHAPAGVVAAAASAELVVLGRTGRHLGPVTRAVIRGVRCPVVVVPDGRRCAEGGTNAQNR